VFDHIERRHRHLAEGGRVAGARVARAAEHSRRTSRGQPGGSPASRSRRLARVAPRIYSCRNQRRMIR
jgi:hypothetical protein